MTTWICLFRGINVGGHNVLPMAELRNELESLELKNVRTYIQSGNVVFDSNSKSAASLVKKISRRIESRFGFRPQLFVLNREDVQSAVDANPFPQAVDDPKTLHFYFLAKPSKHPDLEAIEAAKSSSEKFKLTDSVFFLHAPDGIGRSKLAANVEKHLGVVTTARNYRTVDKLLAMVEETN